MITIEKKEQLDRKKSAQISQEDKDSYNHVVSSNIQEIKSSEETIKTSIIQEILSDNVSDIIQEIEKYETDKGNEEIDKIQLLVQEKERVENLKLNITRQIGGYNLEAENLDIEIFSLKQTLDKKKAENKNKLAQHDENINNLEKLKDKILKSKIEVEKKTRIEEKINAKEELRLTFSMYKKKCKEEQQALENELNSLSKKQKKFDEKENAEAFEEIDRFYTQEYENLLVKKKDLFEQNKLINSLTRKIQIYPSKLEMIQYQKRFQELYDQINKISEISRKYISEINSREEIKGLLTQKVI